MVIYLIKMVIYPIKMVIYPNKHGDLPNKHGDLPIEIVDLPKEMANHYTKYIRISWDFPRLYLYKPLGVGTNTLEKGEHIGNYPLITLW